MTPRQDRCPSEGRGLALLPVLLIAAACASTVSDPGLDGQRGTASYVIDGRQLAPGAPLWASLRDHVPGIRVFATAGQCPAFTLRRARRASPISTPLVYVDGIRTVGTCTLTDLSPRDVDRIEVYPGGVSHRPGYVTHATGLILIFMRRR